MKSHRALLPLSLLLAAPALAQAPNVGALPETEKVRGDLPPPPLLTSIALSDAQNEFAAFQLVVAASGAPVTVEDVSLSDLTGPGGAKLSGASALVYREAMVAVMSPSNSAGAVGDWPDPLVPKLDDFYGETRNAFPVTVSAGRSQPFYLELHVPAGQPPGGYAGAATASFSDGTSASVPVTLRVRAFALPSTSSLTTAFGFDWDGPCVGHFGGYGAPNCTDPQLEALNALYFQDALNHRLTISALVYAPPVSSGQGSFSTFDQLYGPFLNGTALTKPDQLQGAQLTSIQYVGDWSSASFAAWAAHFKANGWFSRLFDYTCDEPPMTCAWSDIPTRAAIVHAGDPNFRTLVTTDLANATANGVLSSIDILVPIDNSLDPASGDTRPAYANFLTTPDSLLWTYQSCSPTSTCVDGAQGGDPSWPMRYLDESAASNRLLEWVDFAENVTGELYYDTTMSMAVYGAAAWQNEYVFGNNGDGSLFYPGSPSIVGGTHDIPIESLRLKLLRGGLQDYQYLPRALGARRRRFGQGGARARRPVGEPVHAGWRGLRGSARTDGRRDRARPRRLVVGRRRPRRGDGCVRRGDACARRGDACVRRWDGDARCRDGDARRREFELARRRRLPLARLGHRAAPRAALPAPRGPEKPHDQRNPGGARRRRPRLRHGVGRDGLHRRRDTPSSRDDTRLPAEAAEADRGRRRQRERQVAQRASPGAHAGAPGLFSRRAAWSSARAPPRPGCRPRSGRPRPRRGRSSPRGRRGGRRRPTRRRRASKPPASRAA